MVVAEFVRIVNQAMLSAPPNPAAAKAMAAWRWSGFRSVPNPRLYQVLLLNDDFTPMEFVVMVLQEYFRHDLDTATQIMLKIHHEGAGLWGLYQRRCVHEGGTGAGRFPAGGPPLQCIRWRPHDCARA